MAVGFGLYCPPESRLRMTLKDGPDTLIHQRIAPAVDKMPGFVREHVLREFERRGPLQWLGESAESAPDWLKRTAARLVAHKLPVAFDRERTRTQAERMATLSRKEKTYDLIERLAMFQSLPMPAGNRDSTPQTLANRCYEPKVWRRLIEVGQTRAAESCLREIGFIERRSMLYCTDLALLWFKSKMRAQLEYLKSHAVQSSTGEQLNLFEVSQRSVSNPAIRRAELMTRMSGFEAIARERGDAADFWTLTCPSEYHSVNADGGVNPNFKGHSVRDAQAWLSKMWARSRSQLKRKNILIYGFRVAEPHHDGTPHWHMVLFASPGNIGPLRTVLREHWLSECGGEPGAAHHRVKFKSIDYAQGSATGYISKYVAKNIDGYEVGEDFEAQSKIVAADSGQRSGQLDDDEVPLGTEGKSVRSEANATTTVARVRAWASLHGIRQFQQIGGPPVTLYRELRRIRDRSHQSGRGAESGDRGSTGLSRPLVDVAPIERARLPADAGDWAGYIASVGGIEAGRRTTIALWTEITGECNAYDECRGPQITGIKALVGQVATRLETWRIVRVDLPSSLGPVAITVRDGLSLANPHGWTNPNETSMYGPH